MTITELKEKHNALAEYARAIEQQHIDDTAGMQDDIDSLLARVAALEARLTEIE